MVPDAEAVFFLRSRQLFDITLEAGFKIVQPLAEALAQFFGQRTKLGEGFVGKVQFKIRSGHSLSIFRRFQVGVRQSRQHFGGVAGQQRGNGQTEAREDTAV